MAAHYYFRYLVRYESLQGVSHDHARHRYRRNQDRRCVCDANDSIIQRWRVPTPMDADAINKHIAEIYREAVAAGHTDIEAIGISAAVM